MNKKGKSNISPKGSFPTVKLPPHRGNSLDYRNDIKGVDLKTSSDGGNSPSKSRGILSNDQVSILRS